MARGHSCRCYRKLRKLIDSLESQEAMSDAHGNELYPPGNGIWFVLVPVPPESGGASTDFMGSQYIDSDKAATQDPSTENAENTENAVATQDPYMIMQRMHHPRPQVSDTTDSKKKKKKKKKRRRDGSSHMESRYIDSDEAAIQGATQDASMMMQRMHDPRRQSSDPKKCKDIKKKPKRRRDGSSHTRKD